MAEFKFFKLQYWYSAAGNFCENVVEGSFRIKNSELRIMR